MKWLSVVGHLIRNSRLSGLRQYSLKRRSKNRQCKSRASTVTIPKPACYLQGVEQLASSSIVSLATAIVSGEPRILGSVQLNVQHLTARHFFEADVQAEREALSAAEHAIACGVPIITAGKLDPIEERVVCANKKCLVVYFLMDNCCKCYKIVISFNLFFT